MLLPVRADRKSEEKRKLEWRRHRDRQQLASSAKPMAVVAAVVVVEVVVADTQGDVSR